MPKIVCSVGQHLRALAATSKGSVLTDLDPTTLSPIRQVRGLPNIHRLHLAPDGFSLGYTQRHAKGNPSELYFIDPELRLVRTVFAPNACTSFASHRGDWLVACRDGCVYCFSNRGHQRWAWRVPREGHFEFAWLTVAADSDVILAAEGLYLYALTPHGHLLWDWELPNRHEQSQSLSIPVGGNRLNQTACRTLGISTQAGPDEVRRAYRRMARLTHPDLNPGDPTAADRFRAVHAAFEEVSQGVGAGEPDNVVRIQITLGVMYNGQPITAAITAVTVADGVIGIGTSEGEVYLCNLDGEVREYHKELGRQSVASVLLRDGDLDAAYCSPRIYRFAGGTPWPSTDMPEFATHLVSHGTDVLAHGWKTLWLVDSSARVIGSLALDRKVDSVCAVDGASVVMAGRLMRIPHRMEASVPSGF
ncbi:MAG: DnaJ domain-containing protein [Acidobacteriales bacterium]|nr:DnaJ domain-containing protein [Terriglobales bacterium]